MYPSDVRLLCGFFVCRPAGRRLIEHELRMCRFEPDKLIETVRPLIIFCCR